MRRHLLDTPASYYAIFFAVRWLPLGLCRWLGKNVARLVYVFSARDRQNLAANLSLALGTPPGHSRIRRMVRRLFENYGQYMVDFFLIPQLPPDKASRFFAGLEGAKIIRRALARGKGAILLTAHLGNWEFGGAMLRHHGLPLAVVAKAHNTAVSNRLINRLRRNKGIEVIEIDSSLFSTLQIMAHLRRNGIVAMTGDRNFSPRGQTVSFFGTEVIFPLGPVMLAIKSGAALIPTFVVRLADGRYRAILEEPVPLDEKTDIRTNLEKTARIFEDYIRRYPDQWYCPDPIQGRTQQ